jgi:hypothetical protein
MNRSIKGLSPSEVETLSLFSTGLKDSYGDKIVRVVLFGSRARGEGDERLI